ncbi:inositol phospholipid synthesis and fat-storage-inducing TM-domain-containing protein [Glomus cerebriforme]|uniref:Inositol phospholipid synthesis and fat-storage-inducing TM-domain-containing protein n=1 Tax=Glomus cerebriforme TaxID=658196 RepID=A0A397SQJ5_9GLOM|nr:inositol phospholipid synthesis and fat-storage-inducing TM-domain-containing protein [Glomus cerebriforme]
MAGDLEKMKKESDINVKRNLQVQKSKQLITAFCYVLTVVCGSMFGSYLIQSPLTPSEPSWYDYINLSHKSNILNLFFVKRGWFWTSFIFIIYSIRVIHANNPHQIAKSVMRWILATCYWYIVTQRFYNGPSIIDRIFLYTGGKCSQSQIFEAYVCKKNGGLWTGGHDLSGHCFLLIHASLILWEEMRAISYRPGSWEIAREKEKLLTLIFFFVLLLWWLMLAMTAIYFHSFQEKLTGTILGVLYWALAYIFIFPHYIKWLMPYDTKELEEFEL